MIFMTISDFKQSNNLFSLFLSHRDSIFMNDLCSFLHECIYESTRLNLNVNRELYYEIKHALFLNQQSFLFRKWRLKSSTRLLQNAYKSANENHRRRSSGGGSSNNSNSSSALVNSSHTSTELQLISFLIKYSAYLIQNLDKFYKIYTFFITNSSLIIIHCEQYQRHLAWHLSLNHRHFLFDLLIENYFSIIGNRDDDVLLAPQINPVSQDINNQLFVKMVLAMPVSDLLSTSSTEECWLIRKFFDSNDTQKLTDDNHRELQCLGLNQLSSDEYGIKFCLRLFKTNRQASDYQAKRASRNLYATNAVVFVFMPLRANENNNNYMRENQSRFVSLLQAIESTVQNFMFVSFLKDESQTHQAVEFLISNTFKNTSNLNYTFCHLDSKSSDYVKNNSVLIYTYQKFLKDVCSGVNTKPKHLDNVSTNVSSVSNIYYNSLIKYLESLLGRNCSSDFNHGRLSSIIIEYNSRLKKLIGVLSNSEYKQLAWPMPELVEDLKEKWTLVFWNTSECLENVLRKQFYDLMCLEECDFNMDDEFSDEDDEYEVENENEENNWRVVGYERLEQQIFAYLDKFLNAKMTKNVVRNSDNNSGVDSSRSAASIAIYKLENIVRSNLNTLKQGLCFYIL
jgi:hypothetical protein